MTRAVVAHASGPGSADLGTALGRRVRRGLAGDRPDALIVFAASRLDFGPLLEAVAAECEPAAMIGCSSAGEFATGIQAEGSACAIAIRAADMRFTAALGRGVGQDPRGAAGALVAAFAGLDSTDYLYRTALVLTDALAGHADAFVQQLTFLTAGRYQLAGGGAGDDAKFSRTHVFHGTSAVTGGAVALEILSNKPIGIGASHGWRPVTPPMRVTEAAAMDLISLNAAPAVEVFEEHARATGQTFERDRALPFFLHNVIGVAGPGGYRLRVPLSVGEGGAVTCAAEVPTGSTACIMGTEAGMAAAAAERAVTDALGQLGEHRPAAALFFDCVATRLRSGREFGFELQAVQRALGAAPFAGCNTYGQLARIEGQYSAFHNCTAVVCVFPA